MNDGSSAVGVPVKPAGPSGAAVRKPISLQRTDDFPDWCVSNPLDQTPW